MPDCRNRAAKVSRKPLPNTAAPHHGELLLADAREQLARGLVFRVTLGKLAADGEVEDLRSELREQAAEISLIPLNLVDKRQVFAESADDAVLLGERRNRDEQATQNSAINVGSARANGIRTNFFPVIGRIKKVDEIMRVTEKRLNAN